jgi:pimeloyl-ACP methyl ester carboxylesterase
VSRSWTADRVRALVLDAPVVDWRMVLDHHARINRLPRPVGRLGLAMLGHRTARRVVGVDGPVDLRRMDWVTRAAELRLPVLLVHSEDDEFVPCGPSRRLAEARPDLVTYVPFTGARHTKEWNVDPDRWEREVARFLLRHL